MARDYIKIKGIRSWFAVNSWQKCFKLYINSELKPAVVIKP